MGSSSQLTIRTSKDEDKLLVEVKLNRHISPSEMAWDGRASHRKTEDGVHSVHAHPKYSQRPVRETCRGGSRKWGSFHDKSPTLQFGKSRSQGRPNTLDCIRPHSDAWGGSSRRPQSGWPLRRWMVLRKEGTAWTLAVVERRS